MMGIKAKMLINIYPILQKHIFAVKAWIKNERESFVSTLMVHGKC